MDARPELKIKWEWEAPGSVRAPEHAATWARVEVWVGSECVTLVEDGETGSSRRSIYCPLYPLAEWIAYNWWFVQSDARPAGRYADNPTKTRTLLSRHSIRGSGDGFLWPDLLIIPEGAQTHLVWQRDRTVESDRTIMYLNEGNTRVDPPSVLRELEYVVSEVLTRLSEKGIRGTPLQHEWDAIRQTGTDEAACCHASARLGLDPYSEVEPYTESILRASEIFAGNLLSDFLDAVRPDRIDEAIAWVEAAGATTADHPDRVEKVRALRDEVHAFRDHSRRRFDSGPAYPWEIGWERAKQIRNALGMEYDERFDLDHYISPVQRAPADRNILAAGAVVDRHDPAVVTGQTNQQSVRFTLARALWHHLWGGDNSRLFVVTAAYTDRQKVERAFAAELLAPAAGIAQVFELDPGTATSEDMERVAVAFDVSPFVVRHQVDNQLLRGAA